MRLHAVLGGSLCSVASVVLGNDWERVNIYCDDEGRYRKFVKGLKRLRSGAEIPETILHRIEVPLGEHIGSDMKSRALSVSKMLGGLPRVSEDDVLYYSGTPVDLVTLISMLGFRRWAMASPRGLEISGLGGAEALKTESMKWDKESILNFHGLKLVDGAIVHKRLEPLKVRSGEKDRGGGYKLELNSNGTQIKVVWKEKELSSKKKQKMASRILIMNELLGGDVIHEVPDQSLQLWCMNTRSPLPIHEPEVGPEFDEKSVAEMTLDEISEWIVSEIMVQDEPFHVSRLGGIWASENGFSINSALKPHNTKLMPLVQEIVETRENLIFIRDGPGSNASAKVGVIREGEEE